MKTIRDSNQFEVLGRLAAGVRFDEARAEMEIIAARLRDTYPVNRNLDVRVAPLAEHVIGSRDATQHVARLCGGAVPLPRRRRQRRRLALGPNGQPTP